jgi:hypothetical protein
MKVDSITLKATIHGLTVGRHSACAALTVRAGMLVVLMRQFTRNAGLLLAAMGAMCGRLSE